VERWKRPERGRGDLIPAQVGELLVDSLESHSKLGVIEEGRESSAVQSSDPRCSQNQTKSQVFRPSQRCYSASDASLTGRLVARCSQGRGGPRIGERQCSETHREKVVVFNEGSAERGVVQLTVRDE
jgi:hypothetical protein